MADEIEEELIDDGTVWALWGSYERATLTAVQQGMYQVEFEDDERRWATVMELALANEPLPEWLSAALPPEAEEGWEPDERPHGVSGCIYLPRNAG